MAENNREYRDTLILPSTSFPMKGKLPSSEPKRIEKWEEQKIYKLTRKIRSGKDKFILHDGPPYANGDLHMGTAMNKILKDLVVRTQISLGKDAPYIPGWDCHGLPIEWKIEEKIRAKGKTKEDVGIMSLRRQCREFAMHWIGRQRSQFKRLGVLGDWDNPYLTMDYFSEAVIASEFMRCNQADLVYRGAKPVMWSAVEKTALAEAEIEYLDRTSHTIWVGYEFSQYTKESALSEAMKNGAKAEAVIWTTTPWTIPSSMAICFNPTLKYGAYKVVEVDENHKNPSILGKILIVGDFCSDQMQKSCKIQLQRICEVSPEHIKGCKHPWAKLENSQDFWDYPLENAIPLLPGNHVTNESGSGLVHTAPAHGADDFVVGIKHKDLIHSHDCYVEADGSFDSRIPLLANAQIITTDGKEGNANKMCIDFLNASGHLIGQGKINHSYPHSWRSRAPLIFRATPQWFINIDKNITITNPDTNSKSEGTVRERALDSIENLVEWFPASGQTRLSSMIKDRPDWVVSRQRAWGVPLTLFVRKSNGEILKDKEVDKRIFDAISQFGADIWFDKSKVSELLGEKYNSDDFEQITDILDVWFDSGSTHAFVLSEKLNNNKWDAEDVRWPASMYLEGSDQHRGWFHSSLLESCATRGRAPYNSVLTHGFVLDSNGRKMSKSLGNTIFPEEILKRHGADIMRIWVAATDYSADMKVGDEILKTHADTYRKIRNTFRFLLGNLEASKNAGANIFVDIPFANLPKLEQHILDRLSITIAKVQKAFEEFDYKSAIAAIIQLVQQDLSSFYFDIRKDSLYCDHINDTRRESCVYVMRLLLEKLSAALMPIICFTIDEVWETWSQIANLSGDDSVPHTLELSADELPLLDDNHKKRQNQWNNIRKVRKSITSSLESARASGDIGSSLEAEVSVYVSDKEIYDAMKDIDNNELADLAIVSVSHLIDCQNSDHPSAGSKYENDNLTVIIKVLDDSNSKRCARSWRRIPDVGSDGKYPQLSLRDAKVMRALENAIS